MRSVGCVGLVVLVAVLHSTPVEAAAPYGLTFGMSGQFVSLRWQGDGSTWLVEAVSAPGLSNLVRQPVVSTTRLLSFANVPPGAYYVRIRAKS